MKKNRHNPNDPPRFIKKIAVTTDGEVADKEVMNDGFYAVITDMEGDVSGIIAINERRWKIEECFRIMKTDFEARPIYLQREDRIKVYFLICFISLLIYRILASKLNKKYTTEHIIDTLKKMDVCELDASGYIATYKRTNLTDDLHEFWIRHGYSDYQES